MWSLSSHRCLRTMRLAFPCFGPGHDPEQSCFPFLLVHGPLPGKAPPHLLVACKDYLALLRLAEGRGDDAAAAASAAGGGGGREGEGLEVSSGQRGGGSAPISAALVAPPLGLVAIGRRDSSVDVWEAATGRRRFTVHGAHGGEELSCMSTDSGGRRLITGSRQGTVKVGVSSARSPSPSPRRQDKTTTRQ